MSVKWIKLSTNMFEDEKIKLIEQMPDADTILVVWLKLYLLSQKNKGIIPDFSHGTWNCEEMLSALLDRDIETVNRVLNVLVGLEIVFEITEGIRVDKFWLSNQEIRNTPEYKEWRKRVFERDSYTCQSCQQKGGELNAHHILSFANHPDKRFEVDNGLTLCIDCHKRVHGRDKVSG